MVFLNYFYYGLDPKIQVSQVTGGAAPDFPRRGIPVSRNWNAHSWPGRFFLYWNPHLCEAWRRPLRGSVAFENQNRTKTPAACFRERLRNFWRALFPAKTQVFARRGWALKKYIVRFRFEGEQTFAVVPATSMYRARLLVQAQYGIDMKDIVSINPA